MKPRNLRNKKYRDKVIAEYFSKHGGDANIQGQVISSNFRKSNNAEGITIGREKEVSPGVFEKITDDIQFRGRAYEGDGTAEIDVSSFVTGTLTAIAKYYNDGTGWVQNYTLTTEIDDVNKTITIANGERMAHIQIFDNDVLEAEYSGCEQIESGFILSDILTPNGNNATLVNATLANFYVEDSEISYSHLNRYGYTSYRLPPAEGDKFTLPTQLSNNLGGWSVVVEFLTRDVGSKKLIAFALGASSTITVLRYESTTNTLSVTVNYGTTWTYLLRVIPINTLVCAAVSVFNNQVKVSINGLDTETLAIIPANGDNNFIAIGSNIQQNLGFYTPTETKKLEVYNQTFSDSELESLSIRGQKSNSLNLNTVNFIRFFKNENAIIPASLSNPNQDVLGNPLEFKGQLAPRAQIVESPYLVLNGVDQRLTANAGTHPSINSIKFDFYFKPLSTSFYPTIIGIIRDASNGYWGMDFNTSTTELRVYRRNNVVGQIATLTGISLNLNQTYHIILDFDSTTSFKLIIDDIETVFSGLTEVTFSSMENLLLTFDIANLNSSAICNGEYFGVKLLINDQLVTHYPMSESNGTKVYDVSGNNHHGTVVNAVLPDIWGSQDVYHYSFYEGYWLYEDANNYPLRLPVDAGASIVINSITYTRLGFEKGYKQTGKWNGASKIKFPDIPEIPSELRGNSFVQDEVENKYLNYLLSSKTIRVTNDWVNQIDALREGVPLDPLDNLAGLTLFNAYRPQMTGGVINAGDGNVDEMIDWKSGINLTRISAASAPTQSINGDIIFDPTSAGKLLRADVLPSDYNFTCNGESFALVSWLEMRSIPDSTQYMFATRSAAVTDSGMGIANTSSNGQFVNIRNGATNKAYGLYNDFWADTNRHQLACFFKNNGVGNIGWEIYLDGVLIYTVNVSSAIDPLASAFVSLSVGGSGSIFANMSLWDLHVFKGEATAADKSVIFHLPYNYYS